MEQLAQQFFNSDTALVVGTIKSILDNKYVVHDKNGRILKTTKASSCMITPSPNDKVLVATDTDTAYILAVLNSADADATNIELPGDVTISAPSGNFSLNAQKDISMFTPGEFYIISKKLGLSGEMFIFAFQAINAYSNKFEGNIHELKIFSRKLKTTINTVAHHFVSRHTQIEGVDSTKASVIKQTAKDIMSLKSKFAFINAKKNVKVDGQQILMG